MSNQRYPDKFGVRKAQQTSFVSHSAPRSLSESDLARLRELSNRHLQLLPEFEPFLKELYRCGLIDGRRALLAVQKINADPVDDSSGLGTVAAL